MDPTAKGILIGVFMALTGYALSRLGKSRDRKTDDILRKETVAIEAVKERDKRIDELERDVEKLKAQMEADSKSAVPITAAMQQMLIAKLTNDHTPEADALLKKQTDRTLTAEDAIEFAKAMEHRSTDMDPRISEAQRIAAEILPGVIRLRELAEEAGSQGTKTKTLLVTVPETETIKAADGGTQQQEKGN